MSDSALEHVLAAAAAVFGRTINADDEFFAVGGDSVTAVELAVELEDRLGVGVDADLIVSAPRFGALAAVLGAPARAR